MRFALIFALASTLIAQNAKPTRDFSEKDFTGDPPNAVEPAKAPTSDALSTKEAEMRAIAERFSPILFQRTAWWASINVQQ